MAWSYERFELEDVRLFKTADFDCSRSGNLRTVFGTRLRLLFAIGSGLRCRGEKHDPVPDLLTTRPFIVTLCSETSYKLTCWPGAVARRILSIKTRFCSATLLYFSTAYKSVKLIPSDPMRTVLTMERCILTAE
jgi:hypothetical protein